MGWSAQLLPDRERLDDGELVDRGQPLLPPFAKRSGGLTSTTLAVTSWSLTFRITISRMEKPQGKAVSEEPIQAWADEAEAGYDVGQLRRRGRKPVGDGPGRVVPVRLDESILAALDERAAHDHVSRSEAIRSAIRAYVA
jgi:hypothetical protein